MKRLLGAIEMIKQSSIAALQDVTYVRNIIRFAGLYGNDFKTYNSESIYGCNDEFGVWQEPTQSAQFLIYTSSLKPKSLIEIGSHNGCWAALMTAYFLRFNQEFQAVSVDILPSVKIQVDLPLRFEICSSDQFKDSRFDVAFIDGGREYQTVLGHYMNVGKKANVCAFHDINCKHAPDIIKLWDELKQNNFTVEFIFHPGDDRMMGIGIIENRVKIF